MEIVTEIMEEIAYTRVIAVAQYNLVLEMRPVMLQFVFYIYKLGVKLILLAFFRIVQLVVFRHRSISFLNVDYWTLPLI